MSNYYLIKVWKNSKPLFFIVLFFIAGQLFFSYKQVETLPFFNYGMYSEICRPQSSYSTIALYSKTGNRINLFESHFSPTFLQYQLSYYARLIRQDSIDPVQQTIAARFGTNTNLSNYLNIHLSNPKTQINESLVFLAKKTNWDDFHICKENYVWVKNNFKLVKSKRFN